MPGTLYLVLPCYNEEEVLGETARRLREKMGALTQAGTVSHDSRILFVDDGSSDATWKMIEELCASDPVFSGAKLSRNRGHQNALLAGLMSACEYCDMAISMDADLQDDIDAVDVMLEKYAEGCDIVYGVRSDRVTDTVFKRMSAQSFYRVMKLLGVDLVYNHADYRLMSRRAVEALGSFSETNLFLRGIVPLIGYKSAVVGYHRGERFAGKSKYPLRKMLSFAWDGVSSFSAKPIRFITVMGFLIFIASLCLMVYTVILNSMGRTVPGWSTLMVSIWFLGGLQVLSLGIIGEYIGKIYREVKARPKYIVEKFINRTGDADDSGD